MRNGYPYGTATATSKDRTLTTSVGSTAVKRRVARRAGSKAAINLVVEVEKMARKVKEQASLRRPRPAQSVGPGLAHHGLLGPMGFW